MTTPCPGAVALRARWAVRSLAGAFLDLALAWACLCLAALLAAAARNLALPCLPLPYTCARPHLPCLLALLARYPPRAHASEEPGEERDHAADAEDADPRSGEEARAELQRELEKEHSAVASAAKDAMAMILRLQKEKSVLKIEARQQRRIADERCAFFSQSKFTVRHPPKFTVLNQGWS
ncbi:hypothetical protein C2845_PM09G14110 [Panicum miliaceum]|uniref:GTD-binding domain-containing protein n=1 Tax=Panicum miliaceum TaxID=4540 RepID=A0A3L6RX35_PANMI|nr:hypothetical protein C2845_PM09G14110 [Panicum miliaceum]